jgi:hypothetical protein
VPSVIIGGMDDHAAAAMNEPTTDDLASVLAIVIASSRTAEDIRDHTGAVSDKLQAAIAQLVERDIIRKVGGHYYHASQSLCAGPCSRGGRLMRGYEVVINPQTLRWMCAACWDAKPEPDQNAALDGERAAGED